MRTAFMGLVMVVACIMASSQAFSIQGRSEAETIPSADDQTDLNDTTLSEMVRTIKNEPIL